MITDESNQLLINRKDTFVDFGGILMSTFVNENQQENMENSLH